MAVARIENSDRSDHYVAPPLVNGEPKGDPIVIPAGRKEGGRVVPGVYLVGTKADLDTLTRRLGKGLSDDGSTLLRLVRLS